MQLTNYDALVVGKEKADPMGFLKTPRMVCFLVRFGRCAGRRFIYLLLMPFLSGAGSARRLLGLSNGYQESKRQNRKYDSPDRVCYAVSHHSDELKHLVFPMLNGLARGSRLPGKENAQAKGRKWTAIGRQLLGAFAHGRGDSNTRQCPQGEQQRAKSERQQPSCLRTHVCIHQAATLRPEAPHHVCAP
jgi:hypothetical protein